MLSSNQEDPIIDAEKVDSTEAKLHLSSLIGTIPLNNPVEDNETEQNSLYDLYNISPYQFSPPISKTTSVKSGLKKIGNMILYVGNSGAPAYLFTQILPSLPNAHYLMCFVSFALNGKIGRILNHLTTNPAPLKSLRNEGNGSIVRGMLKEGIKNVNALSGVLLAGGGLNAFIMHYRHNSEGEWMRVVFDNPAICIPFLGVSGLIIDQIILKAWDYCWPKEKVLTNEGEVNLLQEFGQYGLSLFDAITWSTTIDWYLKTDGIVLAPHWDMLLLMGCYIVPQFLKYACSPDPIIVAKNYHLETEEEMFRVIHAVQPDRCDNKYRSYINGGISLFLLTSSYVLCLYETSGSICANNNNSLANRFACDGLVLGSALLADYIAKCVTPKVMPKIWQAGLSLFSAKEDNHAYQRVRNYDIPEVITESDQILTPPRKGR